MGCGDDAFLAALRIAHDHLFLIATSFTQVDWIDGSHRSKFVSFFEALSLGGARPHTRCDGIWL